MQDGAHVREASRGRTWRCGGRTLIQSRTRCVSLWRLRRRRRRHAEWMRLRLSWSTFRMPCTSGVEMEGGAGVASLRRGQLCPQCGRGTSAVVNPSRRPAPHWMSGQRTVPAFFSLSSAPRCPRSWSRRRRRPLRGYAVHVPSSERTPVSLHRSRVQHTAGRTAVRGTGVVSQMGKRRAHHDAGGGGTMRRAVKRWKENAVLYLLAVPLVIRCG
ncbi:hypothetical protein B0H16DRAFT_1491570 [Mycena metata]|uniref:Uncharacterized protein n=1 Tax=Mycena metata TaxID=1033252 RepID=A0AAD7KEQ1_9AGAR|nr:hypothetical protein B0H16DRAFT_1491570 [Mycena metata]